MWNILNSDDTSFTNFYLLFSWRMAELVLQVFVKELGVNIRYSSVVCLVCFCWPLEHLQKQAERCTLHATTLSSSGHSCSHSTLQNVNDRVQIMESIICNCTIRSPTHPGGILSSLKPLSSVSCSLSPVPCLSSHDNDAGVVPFLSCPTLVLWKASCA